MDMPETGSQGGTFSAVLSMMDHLNATFHAQPVKQVSKIIPTAVIYDQNIWKAAAQQVVNYQW